MIPTAATANPADLDYTAPSFSHMAVESDGKSEGGVTTMAKSFSPSGCYGQSNYPHKSTSTGTKGDVKGLALSKCQFDVDRLYVKASVWQKRWWGWQQKGEARQGSKYNAGSISRSGYYNGCLTNDWRTVGNHYSIELGKKYSAETMNWNYINC